MSCVLCWGELLHRQNLCRKLSKSPSMIYPMLHENGMSSIWRDVKFAIYILLFVLSSYLNSYSIMLFASFLLLRSKKNPTSSLPLPSPWWRTSFFIGFWDICVYLSKWKIMEKWPYHIPRHLCLIFKFSVLCVQI